MAENVPKTIISVDVWTLSAHAAESPWAEGGSWNAEFTVNGAGGAGFGWKYG